MTDLLCYRSFFSCKDNTLNMCINNNKNNNRSEMNFNESWYLAEGTEVARLRRRFSFVLQQDLQFRTDLISVDRECACGHPKSPLAGPGACARALYRGGTRFEGGEGANGDGNGVGFRNGVSKDGGDGDGSRNGNGGVGERTIEIRER